jgi:ribosomal protein L29
MKINDLKKELRELNAEQIQEKLDAWQRELFSLKLNATTAHIKDYSQFHKVRKNIARALTYIRQKNELQ